jgi:hypothetical protein
LIILKETKTEVSLAMTPEDIAYARQQVTALTKKIKQLRREKGHRIKRMETELSGYNETLFGQNPEQVRQRTENPLLISEADYTPASGRIAAIGAEYDKMIARLRDKRAEYSAMAASKNTQPSQDLFQS